MNPGKRRKLQKIEFIKNMIEKNLQALKEKVEEKETLPVELKDENLLDDSVKVEEKVEESENVLNQISKRKKKTS